MPDTRDLVFDRLTVDHLVRGSTRVSWGIFYQFADPQPWEFILQVGSTGNPGADDWQDVGLPAMNVFYAVDDVRRDFGTVRTLHYRVKLVTPKGTYFSRPAAVYGTLGLHDWLLAREIVRKEFLRHGLVSVPGWLLKRRRSGQPLPKAVAKNPAAAVVDPLTGDIISRSNAGAELTYGAEYLGGYYAPMPASVSIENPAFFDAVVEDLGNANPDAVQGSGRAVILPSWEHRDVFVAAHSDLRYEVGKIKVAASHRGVPLVGDPIELRQIPLADIVYTVPVPGSLP